jgi:hypothetical protein
VLKRTCGMLCRGQLFAHLRLAQLVQPQPRQPTASGHLLLQRLLVPQRATQLLQTCRQ